MGDISVIARRLKDGHVQHGLWLKQMKKIQKLLDLKLRKIMENT